MLVINLNNNRSRKLAWMREESWLWHLVHTDTYVNTKPVFGTLEMYRFKRPTISLGQWNRPQGPPKDFCTEKLGGKLNTNLIDDCCSSGL